MLVPIQILVSLKIPSNISPDIMSDGTDGTNELNVPMGKKCETDSYGKWSLEFSERVSVWSSVLRPLVWTDRQSRLSPKVGWTSLLSVPDSLLPA